MSLRKLKRYRFVIRPPPFIGQREAASIHVNIEIWKDGKIFHTIDSFDKNNRFFWAKESVAIETSPKMSNP